MTQPNVHRATYDDLLAAPPNKIGELIDGALHLTLRPKTPMAATLAAWSAKLAQCSARGSQMSGAWVVLHGVAVRFGDDVLVPDLAGWRPERLSAVPDMGPLAVVPDWVCEMVSPDTVQLDRVTKKQVYCHEKVEYLWYIDTNLHTLETHHWLDGHFADVGAYSDDDRVRAVPFEAIELDLGALWADFEEATKNPSL